MIRRTLLPALLLAACRAGDDEPVDTDADVVARCPDRDWAANPWNAEGPYGTYRHARANDARLPLVGGGRLSLAETWTGCDTIAFVPDNLFTADVQQLLEDSPRNARWIFVSRQSGDAAEQSIAAMAAEVDAALAALRPRDRTWWTDRVHVVRTPALDLPGWVGNVLTSGIGVAGFAIDRSQRLRGLGSMADVKRYVGGEGWPWGNNVAMAARDVAYLDRLVARYDAVAADTESTVVPLFTGEVIAGFADTTVDLPGDMAAFDTLEIVVDMRCPDPEAAEFNNCGAWDYLAHLYVQEGDGDDAVWTELARFITTYHRESFWTFDASPMLPLLDAGGERTFRWLWAPEWNTQPTETRLELRFSNRGKPDRATRTTRVFTGGTFGPDYNTGREPVEADVPTTAKRVELWSLLTGHGGGTNNCAEFCNHEHELTVEGTAFAWDHPDVGDDEACVRQLRDGMTPNQWGTWWFGRGGWCPGQQVEPVVYDVTDRVTPGQSATLTYRGLLNGAEPPEGAGNILLNTWWVVYE